MLIVVDTLRADRLGAYGNTRGLTPFLDELAARGTVFLNAYSTTSYTSPAVASLFTSRYPSQHRVINYDSTLSASEDTLAEQFAAAGYATAGFTANILLAEERGFEQGFHHWFSMKLRKMRGDVIRKRVRLWLDGRGNTASSEPVFLYLHYLEPHAPYEPPQPYRKRFAVDTAVDEKVVMPKTGAYASETLSPDELAFVSSLYDAEVAALDAELRLLFDELGQRSILANAVVVITADHGEEFHDHGRMGHGRSLYNEMVQVPLIVIAPKYTAGTVDRNVSLVDVAPTLLALIGQPAPQRFEGRSRANLLGGDRGVLGFVRRLRESGFFVRGADTNSILVELERMNSRYDLRRHTAGMIHGSTKLLQGPVGEEIYDLDSDPRETTAVQDDAHTGTELRAMLEATQSQLKLRAAAEAETRPLDDATKEKLRALGYNPQ